MRTLVKWGELRHYQYITISCELSFVFWAAEWSDCHCFKSLENQNSFLSAVTHCWIYLCMSRRSRVLNQRLVYLSHCVSHWKHEEYRFCLQKTEIGMLWYSIPMPRVHFKTGGQAQVVLRQVRCRNNKTSNPRLFSYNLACPWFWEKSYI